MRIQPHSKCSVQHEVETVDKSSKTSKDSKESPESLTSSRKPKRVLELIVKAEDESESESDTDSMSSYDGHASKKLRTNIDGHGVQSGSRDRFEDRDKRKSDDDHRQEPSPVVHVRSLHPGVLESDIFDVLSRFGKIVNIFMMNRKHQALVEFESVDSSMNLVRRSQTDTIFISNHPALFNYSKSSKIDVPSKGDRHESSGGDVKDRRREHNVLLFTVSKPLYPITVEVMHTICKPFGEVARIVIFRKSVLQSMVEFDSVDAAICAKKELQGADVYSGCCTLKIEYAKPLKLNVYRNDSESWDFTNPNVGRSETNDYRGRPLLADPDLGPPRPFGRDGGYDMGGGGGGPMGRYDGGYDNYGGGGGRMQMDLDDRGRGDRWMDRGMRHGGGGGGGGGMFDDMRGGRGFDAMVVAEAMGRLGRGYMDMDMDMDGRGGGGGGGRDRGFNGPQMALLGGGQGIAGGNAAPQQNCVLMFYGMNPDQMNCDRLFNLVCLYGNVVRIKFLKSKDGAAMVQMGDAAGCERVLQNLNNMTAFEHRFQITYSKQSFLQDQANPGELKDGTPAFVDYMGNKNNRFSTPDMAAKNRIQPPGEILHYFNAPLDWEEEDIVAVLIDAGCEKPEKVKVFPAKSSNRSSSGLLQWDSKRDATDAICLSNHLTVRPDGRVLKEGERDRDRSTRKNSPFIIKLCFSAAPIV